MTDKKYKFTVSEEQNLKRVDQFIVEELPTFSRTKISKLIKEGALLVNNEPIEERSKKVSFGDEVVGFNRALFYTGTQSIVSALWRINDVASAITMKRFYRYLAEGDPKDIALRKSQLLVRKYFPHPSYWAAYRLMGQPI